MACKNKFSLSVTFAIAGCLLVAVSSAEEKTDVGAQQQQQQPIDPLVARSELNSDFESGFLNPWYDESRGFVAWRVEDVTGVAEPDNPAPRPLSGRKYVRATRNANLDSGLAVLSSPVFTAMPGDKVTFDFWIRSKRPEGNTLELVWLVGHDETLLASATRYSTSTNMEWRSITAEIPVNAPTDGTLLFYGYCGYNYEDAIAIDNIKLESVPQTTTTARPIDRCKVDTATSDGVYITSPNFPENYPNNASECWVFDTTFVYLELDFLSFLTESYADKLTVYGYNGTLTELGSYTGSLSSSYWASYYGFNTYTIVFESDASTTYTGFLIRVYGSQTLTTSSGMYLNDGLNDSE